MNGRGPSGVAALAPDESDRLQRLDDLDIVDSDTEERFDELVQLAARLCGTPIALLTFVTTDRQWFKARRGLDIVETDRESAFCSHTILGRDTLIIEDAAHDPRFERNRFVTEDPKIRFYAGTPILFSGRSAVGSLCVIDRVPRQLTDDEIANLELIGRQVEHLLRSRVSARRLTVIAHQLEIQERRLQCVLEGLVQGVVVHRPDGSIEQVNDAAQHILGLTADELYGRTPTDPRWSPKHSDGTPFPGDELPASVALRDGVAVRDTTMGVSTPDGEERWLMVSATPLADSDGTPAGCVSTFVDLTAPREMNRRLEESLGSLTSAMNERDALVRAVSHDLRSPVAAVRLLISVLADRDHELDPSERQEILDRLGTEARRTEGILLDLASVDRIRDGQWTPRRQPIDVGEFIRSVMPDLRYGNQTVILDPAAEDLPVSADPVQLTRIIDNLVGNAFKHTPTMSTIWITPRRVDDEVHISVDDDGPGMTDRLMVEAFEPYVRGAESHRKPGSGLGLFIVRASAEAHGGRAWLDISPHGGTRATVAIPLRS